MQERFIFESGAKMNPYWIYKSMAPSEKNICDKLLSAGYLGWNSKSINASHIKKKEINSLVEAGVVNKEPLLQVAKNILNNEVFIEEIEDLESDGGFLSADKRGKELIRTYDSALEIVNERDILKNREIRFTLNNDLLQYLEALL